MATYRLEAKVISRAKGRSATGSAAYRSGAAIEDERTGLVFDYTRKRGVLHSEIIAPEKTPAWMLDRASLWNAVERVEKRSDAQLARDFIFSLPHELTDQQRVELMRDFIAKEFVARGMIGDFSIHAPDRRSDERNHHAHVMVTMRELTGAGFGLKNRDWNKTALLDEWREHWADTVNSHLERHGHDARVDHRSLEGQGIDREPEPKQGPIATEMERNGKSSHAGNDRRDAKARNDEREDLSRAANDIEAELIMLDPGRPRGPAFEDVREGLERNKSTRGSSVRVVNPDGGLVAQQAEAMRRFKKNSDALNKRRIKAPASPEPISSGLDDERNNTNVPEPKSERQPMTPHYNEMRAEQAKATGGAEPPAQKQGPETGRDDPPTTQQEPAQQERVSKLNWSMDQSMPAQNAAANRWAQEGQARRQDQSRDDEGEKSEDLGMPDRDPQARRGRLDPEQQPEGPPAENKETKDEELSFRRDVSPQQRTDLKREQSEQDIESAKNDDQELSFRKDRGKGPDLDR